MVIFFSFYPWLFHSTKLQFIKNLKKKTNKTNELFFILFSLSVVWIWNFFFSRFFIRISAYVWWKTEKQSENCVANMCEYTTILCLNSSPHIQWRLTEVQRTIVREREYLFSFFCACVCERIVAHVYVSLFFTCMYAVLE